MKWFLTLVTCSLALGSCAQNAPIQCSGQCVLVVDAGSTGSRLHLFQHDSTAESSRITELLSHKQTPGIASLGDSPKEMTVYLNKLFSSLRVSRPLPVYFYATAGMRLLPTKEQELIYQRIKEWFEQEPRFDLQEAKTITGKQEGVYSWLAVNDASKDDDWVGVMDLGGASVQIAFPIDEVQGISPRDISKFSYQGKEVTLFVKSFLGLGQTEVTHQFLNSQSCFPNGYVMPNGHQAKGDAKACTNQLKRLINGVHGVKKYLAKPLVAKVSKGWSAMGGLNYLVEARPFEGLTTLSMDGLRTLGDREICQEAWQKTNSVYGEDKYLYEYCFMPAYYHALIVEGYGLLGTEPIYHVPTTQSQDWTLGVVRALVN